MKRAVVIAALIALLMPAPLRAQEQDSESPPIYNQMPAMAQHQARQDMSISDQMANNFYTGCMRKATPDISPENMQAMCKCSAEHMQTEMATEKIEIMKQDDEAGRKMLNHMLLDVYAPCMGYPVESKLETQCLNDPQMANIPAGVDRGQICRCMAQKTGAWLATNGRAIMTDVLSRNPNIYDPIGPVMDDPTFKKASYQNLASCLSGGGAP